MLERDSLDEAIKHLQRANDLAKEQKLNFGDDIAIQLRIARKKRWNIQEEKRIQQEIELQTYLNRLILEDRDRKIDDLRKTGEDVDLQVGLFFHFTVPLGDCLEKKKYTAIIIKQQFGFPISTT